MGFTFFAPFKGADAAVAHPPDTAITHSHPAPLGYRWRLLKPFDYQCKDPKALKKLNWNKAQKIPPHNLIGAFPWSLTDSTTIVYCNAAERKAQREAEAEAGGGKAKRRPKRRPVRGGMGMGGGGGVSIHVGKRRHETGIKIHVASHDDSEGASTNASPASEATDVADPPISGDGGAGVASASGETSNLSSSVASGDDVDEEVAAAAAGQN